MHKFCYLILASLLLNSCGKTAYQSNEEENESMEISKTFSSNPENLNLGGYLSISCFSPQAQACLDAIVEVEVMQKPKDFCQKISPKMHYIGRGCELFAKMQVEKDGQKYAHLGSCSTEGMKIYFFDHQDNESELCSYFTDKLELSFSWLQNGDSSLLSKSVPIEAKKHSLSKRGELFGRELGRAIAGATDCCQSL